MWKLQPPWRKSHLHSQQPPSKSWGPAKPPAFLKIWLELQPFTLPPPPYLQKAEGGGGAHYVNQTFTKNSSENAKNPILGLFWAIFAQIWGKMNFPGKKGSDNFEIFQLSTMVKNLKKLTTHSWQKCRNADGQTNR